MHIIKKKYWNNLILCQEPYYTHAMLSVLQDLELAIKNAEKILKDDNTSTVVVVTVDQQRLVIKRANTKSWFHRCRRFFAVSRAQKNWKNALLLHKLGIPSFSPIALVEERLGWFKKRSYFICTYVEGIDLLHYFACGAKPLPEWPQVAMQMATMLEQLANNKISHRDLNLSNIILKDGQLWLIDLDSMRHHWSGYGARRGAVRDKQRFMENWMEAPELAPEVPWLFQNIFGLTN